MQWRIIAKVSIWIYLSTEIHKKFSIKLQMQMQSQWNVQNINTWWLVEVEGDSLHPSLDTHGAGAHCRVTMSLHCSLATLYHPTYLPWVLPKHSYGQFAVTGTISSGWSILTSLLSQNTNHLATRASLGPSQSLWSVNSILESIVAAWTGPPLVQWSSHWSAQFCSAGREEAAQFVLLSSPSFCLVFVNLPGNWTEFTELTQLSWMHTVRESAAIWPLSPDIQNISIIWVGSASICVTFKTIDMISTLHQASFT